MLLVTVELGFEPVVSKTKFLLVVPHSPWELIEPVVEFFSLKMGLRTVLDPNFIPWTNLAGS